MLTDNNKNDTKHFENTANDRAKATKYFVMPTDNTAKTTKYFENTATNKTITKFFFVKT